MKKLFILGIVFVFFVGCAGMNLGEFGDYCDDPTINCNAYGTTPTGAKGKSAPAKSAPAKSAPAKSKSDKGDKGDKGDSEGPSEGCRPN